jgi:hypothetical protein
MSYANKNEFLFRKTLEYSGCEFLEEKWEPHFPLNEKLNKRATATAKSNNRAQIRNEKEQAARVECTLFGVQQS